MKVIAPSFDVVSAIPYADMLNVIERAYRVCYASEPQGDSEKFIRSKMNLKHDAPLEHISISIELVVDRGVSHELVRHRLASFCQESTRYANYSKDKFGKEITVIKPFFFDADEVKTKIGEVNKYDAWWIACLHAELAYMTLLGKGATPQEARSVLPNSLATKILVTANLREWRHIFNLRVIGTTGKPHPQMVEAMLPVLNYFKIHYPIFFEDLIMN
jgi:thymidylate synthase (FAD)